MKTITTELCAMCKIWGWNHDVIGSIIAVDVLCPFTGEIVIKKDHPITEKTLEAFIKSGIDRVQIY